MKVDDVAYLVIKLPDKVPAKKLRELKKEMNASVDMVFQVSESKE